MSRGDGLNRFRARFFLAAALLGGVAGALAGFAQGEPRSALALAMVGPLLLFLGGGLGGFAGMLLAAALEHFRGRRPDLDPAATDAAMLLAVFGSLLGLLVAVFSGAHATAHWWAAAGAFAGGLSESLLGRVAAVLLHLAVLDELTDQERARERKAGAQGRDLENLLADGEEDRQPPERR
ncbi:MAG: hypothetical protein AB1916_10720 [Thermodesulfobacteriota bacterium]